MFSTGGSPSANIVRKRMLDKRSQSYDEEKFYTYDKEYEDITDKRKKEQSEKEDKIATKILIWLYSTIAILLSVGFYFVVIKGWK